MTDQPFESAVFKHGTPQGLAFYHWNGKIPACRKCLQCLDRSVKAAIGFVWPDALPGDDAIRQRRLDYHERYNPNRPESIARRTRRAKADKEDAETELRHTNRELGEAQTKLSRGYMAVRHVLGNDAIERCGYAAADMLDEREFIAAILDFHNRLEPMLPGEFLDKHYNGKYGAFLLAAADALEDYDPIMAPAAFFAYCGERVGICKLNIGAPAGWKEAYINDAASYQNGDTPIDMQGLIEPIAYWVTA